MSILNVTYAPVLTRPLSITLCIFGLRGTQVREKNILKKSRGLFRKPAHLLKMEDVGTYLVFGISHAENPFGNRKRFHTCTFDFFDHVICQYRLFL